MHCWINLTSAKVASLKEKYPTLENVKRLSMPSSDELEFCIASHELLLELVNELHDFGSCVSFRKNPNEKPLISIGHDEEIVKQCSFTTNSWTTPDGEKCFMSKDEACDIVSSDFAFHELAFSMKMMADELSRVSACRDEKAVKMMR